MLDHADERQLGVGDVGPVERREAAVELEQQAERGVVLDAVQPPQVVVRELEVEHAAEDVVRHRGDDRVVALGRLGRGLEGARVVARAERAGRARDDLEARGVRVGGRRREPLHGPVDQHPAAAGLDALPQRGEQRLPRAARVAEQLLARLLALQLAPHRQLAPQPRHRDVVGAVAELAAQQRPPDLRVGLLAHRLADPRARGHPLERRDVAAAALQAQHGQPHPDARAQRQRREAQQVQRARERPRAALEEERDGGRQPFELVGHPELLVERGDVAVAREQVVVVALQQVALTDVDRRGLPAEPGPALVDVADVAGLREPVRAHQPGHAGPDHRDAHQRSARSAGRVPGSRAAVTAVAPPSRSRLRAAGDHVQRPLLDLVVDPPEVLADHAEREQLDAADQQDDEQQRRDAALVDAGVAGDDRQRQQQQRERRAGDPGDRRDLQREVRERRHPVEREADHPPERELRLPGAAGGAVVLDDVAPEPDPRAHPAQEAGALAHAQQGVQRRAVEQPEVARVRLELDLGETAHDRVEPACGGELHARLALAHAALGDHDVRAVAPALDHVGDQLGRVLQVAVEHRDGVAARVVEAGRDRHLVPERAREVQHAQPLVGVRELVEDLRGAVGRAVVDDDQLVRETFEGRDDAAVELAHEVDLVEHRGDHAEEPQLAHRRQCGSPEGGRRAPAPGRLQRVVPGHTGCEHVFDVRRAPRPLRLLVPGRRLAAGRAGRARRPSSATGRWRSRTTTRSRARWSSPRRRARSGCARSTARRSTSTTAATSRCWSRTRRAGATCAGSSPGRTRTRGTSTSRRRRCRWRRWRSTRRGSCA